jgi:hypothetical protein
MDTLLPDAAALHAPAALLRVLLGALFALHLVPLSVALGGGLASALLMSRLEQPAFAEAARRIGRTLPGWTAAAATTGAGALPVLLALHGRQALPAAVIMAWPWLSAIAFLAAGVAGFELQARLEGTRPVAGFWLGALATVALLLMAFVFVAHATLLLHPERHLALWLVDSRGTTIDFAEPTLWPRWLHLVGGALAVGALWTAREGTRLEGEGGRKVVAAGALGLVAALGLEALLGGLALGVLPAVARSALLGGDLLATGALGLATLMTLSALFVAWKARRSPAPARQVGALAGHLAAILVLMVVVRDAVRSATLAASPATAPPPEVQADWIGLAAFAGSLALGGAVLAWLWRAWRRGVSAA